MQMVILAGGRATRLRPLTETIPKSMVSIGGRPFLAYQLELLREAGITNIVLCVGFLGEQIKEYFDDGSRFSVQLAYSWEGEKLLGTGGALRNAALLLEDDFLVMYGDSYLMLDYEEIGRVFRRSAAPALMVVFRNEDRYDRSNVVVQDGHVVFYSKTERTPGMVCIDAGLSVLQKRVLDFLPSQGEARLEDLFQLLIARRFLAAYETRQRFYEIGSLVGLQEFREFMAASDHHFRCAHDVATEPGGQ